MNILFVAHSDNHGGAERCLYLLVRALQQTRFRPVVLVPGYGELHAQFAKLGVRTRQSPLVWWAGSGEREEVRRRRFVLGLEERISRIQRICKEERIDLVFSNTSVIVEGALAAAKCGLPHLWHLLEMHRSDETMHSLAPLESLYSMIDLLSDRVIGVSQAVTSELDPFVPSDKQRVIHTGVPVQSPREFAASKQDLFGLPDDTPVVCFVGRLSERKGVMDLVPAAARVRKQCPHARFVIVGADHDRATDFRTAISNSCLTDCFQLMGPRRDVLEIIATSDLLVLPSLVDPLPVVVLEAMSVGIPVVATHSGGCSEMVVDGETGLLVPVNDPGALAESICYLLKHPQERVRMGTEGQQRQKSLFNETKYAKQFLDLFDECDNVQPGQVRPNVYETALDRVLTAADPSGIYAAENGKIVATDEVQELTCASASNTATRARPVGQYPGALAWKLADVQKQTKL